MKTILFIELFPYFGAVNGLLAELKFLHTYYSRLYASIVVGAAGSILEDYADVYNYKFYPVQPVTMQEFAHHPVRKIISFVKIYVKIFQILVINRISLIHCNHYEWSPIAVPVAFLFRIPVIVHLKDVYLLQPKLARFLMKFYKHTTFIAVSKYVKKLFSTQYGISSNRIVMIYDGVDDVVMHPLSNSTNHIKNKTIVMMSRVVPERDIEVFIDIASLLSNNHQLKFVHYGSNTKSIPSPYFLSLQKRVAALGLRNFSFKSYVSDPKVVSTILQKSYLIVVPARQFALPNIAIEAQMCGTPVVAADVGGNKEIVPVHNRYGILIKVNSPILFVQAIIYLLHHHDYYMRISDNAREYAVSSFSVAKQTSRLVILYERIMINKQ